MKLTCMECRWLKLKLGIEITKRIFACPREGVQGDFSYVFEHLQADSLAMSSDFAGR